MHLILKSCLVLLILSISKASSNDCEENALFGQMIEVINGNQVLTQHVLNLTDKFHDLETRLMKYAESFRKIEQSLRSTKVRRSKNEESEKNEKEDEPLDINEDEKNEKEEEPLDINEDEKNEKEEEPLNINEDDESLEIDEWIVIQRRKDGSENFYRSWNDYKKGFGDKNGEFFIGLDKLHKLIQIGEPMELLIVMEDFEGDRRFAKYDDFLIGDESEKYELKRLGEYSGTAGDSLSYHLGQKWSTKDQENDVNPREHCAVWYTGAWWYNACHRSNLNGRYLKGQLGEDQHAQGIHWNTFRGLYYSLKFVEMKIRVSDDSRDSDKQY